MELPRENVRDVLSRYGKKIDEKLETTNLENIDYSDSYVRFKNEMAPELSRYEKWCKSLGSIIKLNVVEKDKIRIQKQLEIAHLDLEAWQPLTLSVMTFLSVFVLGMMISVAVAMINGFANFPFLFFFLVILLSLFLFYYTNGYPERLANKWRLKASSQMVPAILYVVVYMRHTPNLEKAIAFAAENLQNPLALDFRKIFYNVQVGKFSSIKDSLDNYLETWRGYSTEFIEGFHLIESSLFEPDNERRILTLEKSLQVVLDGVYDRMLRFTHDVRSPITNVYMLGVVLPTLGLALLPLASAMIGDFVKWYHILILFDMIIPFFVFYLTDKVLSLRPGGYGETELLERNPLYPKYKSKKSFAIAFLISLPFFIIGFLPLIMYYGFAIDFNFQQIGFGFLGDGNFFDFKDGKGPFGVGALILGMFIPLGVAVFFSISSNMRTKELIIERENTKQLEREFNNSLFQIGNRMGNGVPAELVFGKVAESSKGLMTEDFFRRVNYNVRQMGMSVEKAIFDKQRGAINYYPSDLIATSMKILVESAKKGLRIAAISLMNISQYVKNIHKITDRLKDLLAEIISDMKSNMTFLAPLLSGVVVGLAMMITSILDKLQLGELSSETAIGGLGTFLNIFDLTKMIPPYYLQIIIGVYLIEIIFILTSTLVVIDSGEDKLERTNKTGKNLQRGILLYFVVGLLATLMLYFLSSVVLSGLG